MENVLIINLRRLGDVYSTAHLINSLYSKGITNITLLTYKENDKASKNIKNVKEVIEIDRKEIITLMKNKLFCSGFALENLFQTLSGLKKRKWDHVINYSNDNVSTYITSFLKDSTLKVTGVYFDQNKKIQSSNDWGILFNDILPSIEHSPMHFVDCYHNMAGVKLFKDGQKVITSPKFNQHAFMQLSTVRNDGLGQTQSAKVVAFQLKSSQASKDIPFETLIETIELLRQTPNAIPVLLTAPIDEERSLAQEINAQFDNELVVIETTLNSLASVLMNVDLLVTPDTVVKHLADLTDTPVLEISLGSSPFLKQGSYSKDGLILTDLVSQRDYSSSKNSKITALDINACILYALSQARHVSPVLSEGVTLYKTNFDQYGMSYQAIAGTIDSKIEIHRQLSRAIIFTLLNKENKIFDDTDLSKLNQKEVLSWVAEEKILITQALRDILATMRDLLLCKEKKSNANGFITNIDRIFGHTENASIIQIPLRLFKIKAESLDHPTSSQNILKLETMLFELKSDIQKVIDCLNLAEKNIASLKIKTMISKVKPQPQI